MQQINEILSTYFDFELIQVMIFAFACRALPFEYILKKKKKFYRKYLIFDFLY